MSVTGPGCAACNFRGCVPTGLKAIPCPTCSRLAAESVRFEPGAVTPEERDRRIAEVRARIQERLAQSRPAAPPVEYPPDHAEAAAEIAALLDADDASPEGMVCVMGDAYGPAPVDEVVARLARENERLRADLEALACAVRREHNTRLAWLATLPDGSCPNPPPQALLDAEAATREALRRVP